VLETEKDNEKRLKVGQSKEGQTEHLDEGVEVRKSVPSDVHERGTQRRDVGEDESVRSKRENHRPEVLNGETDSVLPGT